MDLAGATCPPSAASNLTNEPALGVARDFAVSPDGKIIAFSSNNPAANGLTGKMQLYLMDSNGGTPVRCTPETQTDQVGPTWLNAGKQLVWTEVSRGTDKGGLNSATVTSGGTCSTLETILPNDNSRTVSGSSNNSVVCSFGMRAPSAHATLIGLILCALMLRRRRSAQD